jgi:hypothetical protein
MASNATARVCEPKKSPVTAPYNVERYGGEERDIAAFIISADVHRRHLKPKQRREIVADFLKADPTATDRAIAEKAKVDKNTVAKVRREKETRGEIHHVGKRTGTKGRQPPAEKPRKLVTSSGQPSWRARLAATAASRPSASACEPDSWPARKISAIWPSANFE